MMAFDLALMLALSRARFTFFVCRSLSIIAWQAGSIVSVPARVSQRVCFNAFEWADLPQYPFGPGSHRLTASDFLI